MYVACVWAAVATWSFQMYAGSPRWARSALMISTTSEAAAGTGSGTATRAAGACTVAASPTRSRASTMSAPPVVAPTTTSTPTSQVERDIGRHHIRGSAGVHALSRTFGPLLTWRARNHVVAWTSTDALLTIALRPWSGG